MLKQDDLEAIFDQPPAASEAVLALLLAEDSSGARAEALARQWPLVLLEQVEEQLACARSEDVPMPPEGEPEEFLEYARGDARAAEKGLVALATWEMLYNRVGSLSQCRFLAQWMVDKYCGVPLEPVSLDLAAFVAHADEHPDGQYLVRWRAFSWVVHGKYIREGEVYGPHPGQFSRVDELNQVWYLEPARVR